MIYSERDRKAGAGCLVGAGLLGLLPALFLGSWFGFGVWQNLQRSLRSLEWTSIPGFCRSWWTAMTSGRDTEQWTGVGLMIIAGFLIALWQWITLVAGGRTLITARRLWAVSSGYFAAVTILLLFIGYREYRRLEEQNVEDDFSAAITFGALLCAVPVAFLSITLPLWISTPPAPAKDRRNNLAG